MNYSGRDFFNHFVLKDKNYLQRGIPKIAKDVIHSRAQEIYRHYKWTDYKKTNKEEI